MPEAIVAKTLYCGRCYWDRGVLQPLMKLQARRSGSKVQWVDDGPQGSPYVWGCGWCDEERREGGTHVREHIVTGGTHKGQVEVVHIPHIVAL